MECAELQLRGVLRHRAPQKQDAVQVILHWGQGQGRQHRGVTIDDPDGLVTGCQRPGHREVPDMDAIESHGAAFGRIVRQWIAHLK